jgi:WD40 repeat protein
MRKRRMISWEVDTIDGLCLLAAENPMQARALSRNLLSRGMTFWQALRFEHRLTFCLLLLCTFLALPWLITWRREEPEWLAQVVLKGDVWPLTFSPDSRMFATGSARGISLWDSETGRHRTDWNDFDGKRVPAGTYSPDGRTFAAFLYSEHSPATVALIDVDSGRTRVFMPTRHNAIYNLAFAADGQSLRAVLGEVGNVKEVVLWDVATGKETSSHPLTCSVVQCDTAVSADGRLLAAAPFSGKTIRIWDLDADREIARLTNPATAVELARGLAFSDDSQTLAISREDGSFELWDLPARRLKTALPGHTRGYVSNGIRLAPDGRTLASRGEYLRPASFPDGLRIAAVRAVKGQTWWPGSEVIVVDVMTGKRLARDSTAVHPSFSPDGRTIATFNRDYTVRLRPTPGDR